MKKPKTTPARAPKFTKSGKPDRRFKGMGAKRNRGWRKVAAEAKAAYVDVVDPYSIPQAAYGPGPIMREPSYVYGVTADQMDLLIDTALNMAAGIYSGATPDLAGLINVLRIQKLGAPGDKVEL